MTQSDFRAALEQALPLRGISPSRADLLDFVAPFWPLTQENPDIAFWAREFSVESQPHERANRK